MATGKIPNSVIGKKRICSCCSQDYREWKEQDNEGNNCSRCTVSILRKEVKSIYESIDLLCSRLSPFNADQLRNYPFFIQRHFVNEAFKDKILTWHIK